jgi:DNA-binding NtrC family response regulator
VRELESFVKRYLVHGSENEAVSQLGFESRSPRINSAVDMKGTADCGDLKSLVRGLKQETERAAIVQTLARVKGSKQLAAKLLRISLRALQYKIQRYGLGAGAGKQPYVVDAGKNPPVDPSPTGHRQRSPSKEHLGADPFDA